jgi:glycosyltransferase involved in cell wall biosynthesis
MKDLSILIPTYNDCCAELVAELQRQAESLPIGYEVIVADDGSIDGSVVEANRVVNQLPCCRVVERTENSGRAAIRNFLAREARHPWLLFIDSDMVVCRDDYVRRYADTPDADIVVDGGVVIGDLIPGNLRSIYEKAAEHERIAERRRESPYMDFHTANFMVRRDVMLAHPFDQRFRHYGYEDVLFGKQLQLDGIAITHIDNPMSFERFETNAGFISKTEEGLRTLHTFRSELEGYSRLLAVVSRLSLLAPFIRLFHRLFSRMLRRRLSGPQPSLLLFKIYRLGYYMSMQ